MDYLKKKKGSDQLDAMLKLNFTMYREIAETLSDTAEERLIDLAGNECTSHTDEHTIIYYFSKSRIDCLFVFFTFPACRWPSNIDPASLIPSLELVMMDLADAAESFVKAD